MLEFTTERLLPHLPESEPMLVSHLARYRFAETFAQSAVVLDVGCGCGYGTHHLATAGARKVVGVDIAPEAIEYAGSRYSTTNAEFLVGDATGLALEGERFDTVVCLELLEHVPNPEQVLLEARRVLKPDGTIVISTPNKAVFSPRRAQPVNPWHVQEFSREELRSMLESHFDDLNLWGQTFSTRGTLPFTLLHLHIQRYLICHSSSFSRVFGMCYGLVLKAAMLFARVAMRTLGTDPSIIAEVDQVPLRRTMYYIAVGRRRMESTR